MEEINELFDRFDHDVTRIPLEEIEEIARRNRLSLEDDFLSFRLRIFKHYVRLCYEDYHLDDEEITMLIRLRNLLALNHTTTTKLLETEKKKRFFKAALTVVRDGRITKRERKQLAIITDRLRLNGNLAKRLLSRAANDHYLTAVQRASDDMRITDEEMRELENLAVNLGLDAPSVDEATYSLFNRYRAYWLIENDRLPVFPADVYLQAGETVHNISAVKWLEDSRFEYRHEPGQMAQRLRRSSALGFTLENPRAESLTQSRYDFVENGKAYITNKRIIFRGGTTNREVRLNKILGIAPYTNGVKIELAKKKSPFLHFKENIDIFSMTLNHLLVFRR